MALLYPFNDPRELEDHPPTVMVQGEGLHVTDTEGNRYLDAVAGLWCTSLGFSNEALIQAAERQLRRLPYYHSFLGRAVAPTLELAQKVTDLAPAPLSHAFFCCSGSEAVDTAIKFVWYYNNARGKSAKKRVIARGDAYHGSGYLSAGLTGMAYCHEGFDLPARFVLRTDAPKFFGGAEPGETEIAFSRRLAQTLDRQIQEADPSTIAAFIGEPVIGAGGVVPPPEGYWDEIQNTLARYDILLIADEIITGFGRTGAMFASDLYGIRPDIMTIAKQLTGGYMPISGVLMTDDVYQVLSDEAHRRQTFGHGFTYGGHPVAAAVALEALHQYEDLNICNHVRTVGRYLKQALDGLRDVRSVIDVRSVGLMGGVELAARTPETGHRARAVVAEAERRGVLFRAVGETVVLSPPMIAEIKDVDFIVDTMRKSILTIS